MAGRETSRSKIMTFLGDLNTAYASGAIIVGVVASIVFSLKSSSWSHYAIALISFLCGGLLTIGGLAFYARFLWKGSKVSLISSNKFPHAP